MKRNVFVLLLMSLALPLSAQTAHEDLLAIQDNSFLLEEAYNQSPGVVQHIGVFSRERESGEWELAYTEEYPLFSMRHQLSYTVPVVRDGGGADLGDIELNYRYQLTGDADSRYAVAPRLTVIVPTGDDSSTAVEAAIAMSYVLAPRIATHANAGVTFGNGGADISVGQSMVYAPSSRYQLLLEATYARPDQGDAELLVSPGVRWVYNRPSGWQIVPGVGVPIGVGPSSGEQTLLLYLSFEK